MKLAKRGDVVFSFAKQRISFVGLVEGGASEAKKPQYASEDAWATDGWMLPVDFWAAPIPFRPRDHLQLINSLKPSAFSPVKSDGGGTMNYLSSISVEFGEVLLNLCGLALSDLARLNRQDDIACDITSTVGNPLLPPTEREQIGKARVGQGVFRKRVLMLESHCRITGVSNPRYLRASHIKAWSNSSNSERLDGENGLMLAPHVDFLFDKHMISFSDEGQLLLGRSLDRSIARIWGVHKALARPFSAGQRAYLAEHRRCLA